jgi:hypothetical protein
MNRSNGMALAVGIIKMSNSIPSKSEFASIVRKQFKYLEDLPSGDDAPLMFGFKEWFDLQRNSWERVCGYWNVFVDFNIYWDIRDSYLGLTLTNSSEPLRVDSNHRVIAHIDWILDALNPGWRADWPEVGKSDGVQLLTLYASSIKPHARDIFMPAVRPSKGLRGFSWYEKVAEDKRFQVQFHRS